MNSKASPWLAAALAAILGVAFAYDMTLYTDADAHVAPEELNYQGNPVASWNYNYGGTVALSSGGYYNGHPVVYVHFDLSSVPRTRVVSARLKLDRYSHGWTGSGSSSQKIQIFGLMNDADEWDPAVIPQGTGTGQDTPELDLTGSNAPARGPNGPILYDEGTTVSNASRRLGEQICDRDTTPNEGYSVDLEVTDFVNWVMGKNPGFSTFTNLDHGVTFAIHLEYRGTYPYLTVSWKSMENTPSVRADDPRLELELPSMGTVVIFR